MSVWRDVQDLAAVRTLAPPPQGARVLGVDGFYAAIKGQDTGMMVAADMGTGQPVDLARINEKDRPALFAWLEMLKDELGVEVLVSDDFDPDFVAVERLGLAHQLCRFHTLRWIKRLLNNLRKELAEAWASLLDDVRILLETLPPDDGAHVPALPPDSAPAAHPQPRPPGAGPPAKAALAPQRQLALLSSLPGAARRPG
jgi:hypothetical protein